MNFSLVVTDSGPLITLAIAGSLDVLFLPNLPVIVPDMVRHEVIQDLSKPGAALVAEWIRLNDPHRLTVRPTEVFEEFMLLKSMNRKRQRPRIVANRQPLRFLAGRWKAMTLVQFFFSKIALFERQIS